MTVVNPKSISGINSITMASGSDNLLTIHTTNTTERVRVNSDGDVIVGSGITVSPDGDIFATGVCTATTFSGSGANLTNLPAANITGTLPAISGANLTNLDASDLASGTVPTARLGSGTASSSTFLRGDSTFATVTSTTINSNADNRLITGSGTANTLNGESGATYDGTDFTVSSGRVTISDESSGSQFRIGAGSDFQIEHDGSNSYIYNLTNDLLIQCDNNVEITAKSGGTKRFRFDSDGLKFGTDTAAANALDDYEEGEHTITTNSNLTANSSYNKADYTKVGNMVTVSMLLYVSGVSGSDIVTVSLPFANRSESVPRMCNTVGSVMFKGVDTGDNGLIPYLDNGSSVMRFYRLYDNNNSFYALDNSHLSVGDEMYITITYKTAT